MSTENLEQEDQNRTTEPIIDIPGNEAPADPVSAVCGRRSSGARVQHLEYGVLWVLSRLFPVLASDDEKGNVARKDCRCFHPWVRGDAAAWCFQCGAGNTCIRYYGSAVFCICGNNAADSSRDWPCRRPDYSGRSAVRL